MPIRLMASRRIPGVAAQFVPAVPAALAAAVLVAALIPAGCESTTQTPPPVSSADAQRSYKVADDAAARLGYRRDWTSLPYVAQGLGIREFHAFDDAVVVQDGSSTVSVLEGSNGKRRWHNTLANRLTQFVGMSRNGNLVHVSSESEIFTLDMATGQIVGREKIEKLVSTAPVLTHGLLIYGTGTGQVVAHLAGRGLTAWQNATEGGIRVNPVLIGGGTVAFVSQSGRILFLDAASGSRIGETAIYDGAGANPAASDGLLFVASLDQSLYAFAPGAIRPVWRKRTNAPLREAPVHHNGVVYCTLPDQGLTAFEANTGKELWSRPDVRGRPVAERGGRLVVWTRGEAVMIDTPRGDILDRVPLPGVVRLVPDAFVDGNLYAVGEKGVVVKFLPRR